MTWWEFAKRHKGKLIAGSAVLGGAVAFALHNERQREQPHLEHGLQARRHYIFDANQSACDESVRELAPSLSRSLQARFNVDTLTRQLHEGSLPAERKLQLWNELKVVVISRVIALAHAYAMLTLALKAQISILAAEISHGQQTAPPSSWWSLVPSSVSSYFTTSPSAPAPEQLRSSDAARTVFLRSIEYFTQTGLEQLAAAIQKVAEERLKDTKLDEVRDAEALRSLLVSLLPAIEKEAPSFAALVAPIEKDASPAEYVNVLLRRLVDALESEKCQKTLRNLVEFYLAAICRSIPPGALATQLSSLSSAFSRVARTDLDSPLESSLCSSDVHQFAIFAFNLPPSPR